MCAGNQDKRPNRKKILVSTGLSTCLYGFLLYNNRTAKTNSGLTDERDTTMVWEEVNVDGSQLEMDIAIVLKAKSLGWIDTEEQDFEDEAITSTQRRDAEEWMQKEIFGPQSLIVGENFDGYGVWTPEQYGFPA